MAKMYCFLALLLAYHIKCIACADKPNIVVIVADDLGFNDVSFHGSDQIPTPNIDALAYNGIIMNRFYTPPLCTPSRSSLMTGKYPTSLGMHHHVVISDEPWGLGLEEKLLPEYFKDVGYKTHLVGKWHLGFFEQQYTPTKRGFDTFLGYLGPYIDYDNYTNMMFNRNYSRGYDMRRNLDVLELDPKPYATDLFNDEAVRIIEEHDEKDPLFMVLTHLAPHAANDDAPFQAPQSEIDKFPNIRDTERQTYAAMVSIMDRGIGDIVEAIEKKGMLNNTIIMFYSDNGAPTYGIHNNKGSNLPLRGQKESPWEGAVRNVATIYSPLIPMQKRVHNELFHATDILPTLASAAGIKIPTKKNLDGIDQWDSLMYGSTTSRLDILHNIETVKGYSSYTNRGWKIINGTSFDAEFDSWLGAAPTNPTLNPEIYAANVISSKVGKALSTVSSDEISDLRAKATVTCNLHRNSEKIECIPMESPCLFNIIEDPCELNNLANVYPMKMKELKRILDDLTLKVIPTRRKQPDPQSDPIHFNGTWTWWMEDEPIKGNANNFNGRLWTLLVLLNLQYFIYRIFKRYH